MLSKISSVTLNWSQRPWMPVSLITIKHRLSVRACLNCKEQSGGLWLVQIKSAMSRLFEPQAKHYSPLLPPPLCVSLTLLKPELNDSDTGARESLPISPDLVLCRFHDDNIWWSKDGFHNEYFCCSCRRGMHWSHHFKELVKLLNSKIRFDFKKGPPNYLHWKCSLFTPAVCAFPCVPIVHDLFCCLQAKHYTPLCVYLMCWFCCPGREREIEETEKGRRKEREDCQADIWEAGI